MPPVNAARVLPALLVGGAVVVIGLAALGAQSREAPRPRGVISGRVEVQGAPAATERRPGVSDLGMPPARELVDRTRSVIYLETAPGGAFEDLESARVRLDQRNETFVPFVLAITVGTVVDFPNNDLTYHNVFSLSKVRRFDLGRYPKGQSKSVRFDRPGIVRVFCDIHSHMNAFILVFSHRFFAVTDAEGRYRLPAVPPGSYTVMAWNDGEMRESRTVTVAPDGSSAEVDFHIR
jgi:plastocyanin